MRCPNRSHLDIRVGISDGAAIVRHGVGDTSRASYFPQALKHTMPALIIHNMVVVSTPLKNMSSSVGILKLPTGWKNKNHVPNHQPVIIWYEIQVHSYYNHTKYTNHILL